MAGTPEKMLEHLLETQIGKIEEIANQPRTTLSSKKLKMSNTEATLDP